MESIAQIYVDMQALKDIFYVQRKILMKYYDNFWHQTNEQINIIRK